MTKLHMDLGAGIETWSEAQFQAGVEEVAAYHGYIRKYHTHDSRRSDKGFPDLVLVKPGFQIVYIETKVKRNVLSTEQIGWLLDLQLTGQHAYCVYPKDIDLIQAVFRGEIDPPELGIGTCDERLWPLLENQLIRHAQTRRRTS